MPRRLPDRRAGVPVILLALLSALTGCVHQRDASVRIDKVQASLVFGAKPVGADAAPAGASAPPQVTPEDLEDNVVEPPDVLVQFKKKTFVLPTTTTSCPNAPDNASTERELTDNVNVLPAQGTYRFRTTGFILLDNDTKADVKATQRRAFAHAVQVDADTTTFDAYEPSDRGNLLIKHMLVNTHATQVNPAAGVGVVGTPREGDPERGVVIKGMEEHDAKTGNLVGTSFQPTTGLLILPLPVSASEQFQSVAVDRRGGRTIVLQGTVKAAARIDACGELIDGWLVNATVQDSAEEDGEYTWEYIVSPQYGGIIIRESKTYGTDPVTRVNTNTMGQLKPDPLPEGF